jgi:hypothetical protein
VSQVEIRVELPEEVAALLGGTSEAASDEARRAIVLDLLRRGKLSQGSAAHVLGLNRHDVIDLMAAHDVPSGPSSAADLQHDIDTALAAATAAGMAGASGTER